MRQTYQFILLLLTGIFFYSCQGDELSTQGSEGYLRVTLEQSAEVNTKADATYNSKQMRVVIKNAAGVTKYETNDHTELVRQRDFLETGRIYHRGRFQRMGRQCRSGSCLLHGKTTVTIEKGKTATANLVCSLANVKVTVAFEQAFLDKLGNGSIKVQVKSATASITPVDFAPKGTSVAYFPVSDLTVAYTVTTAAGKTNSKEQKISEVSAKDHYILNFKNQATGTGNVTVTIDPTMNQYTYDFTIDPNAKSGATLSANPWSQLAYLTATDITLDSGELSSLKFQYRPKNTDTWMDVATTVNTVASSASATLTGLTSTTAYEYRLTDGEISVATGEFTTAAEIALQNGSLDGWDGSSPNAATDSKFWDTSNEGAKMGGLTPTQAVTDFVHTQGGKAAKLESGKVDLMGGIFAAASLYTGSFGSTNIWTQTATVNFGQSFTARPIALKGFYKYTPNVINLVKNVPAGVTIVKDQTLDQCAIYIALAKKTYTIDNGNQSTFIDFKNDENIIALRRAPFRGGYGGRWLRGVQHPVEI